jgi:hypothetical protein
MMTVTPPPPVSQDDPRKPYVKPAITHDLKLETRAGSTVGIPVPPEDLFTP